MATMSSISVTSHELGTLSVRAEWVRTRQKVSSGEMKESEVHKTLTALLATAKRRGSCDRQSDPRDSIGKRWEDVMYFMVSGRTLVPDEVRLVLSHLNQMGRHLPIPKRARVARSRVDFGNTNGAPNDGVSVFEGVPS
ncbi:MAG: hypothetical protein WC457_03125 [Patescibacteria group bacterium]